MKRKKYKITVLGIFFIILAVFFSIPDGKLRLIFCDVGQGDGAMIIKGNQQILIDAGPNNGKMGQCLDKYVPFWDKKIEGVIISHWDKDHAGGLNTIIKSYRVKNLFEAGQSLDGIEQKVYTHVLKAGDIFRYGEISFEVVFPEEMIKSDNGNSLVVVMNYLGEKFMFTGDVTSEEEGEMMRWWRGEVAGLKVAHHGSETGSSEGWLKRLSPEVAVVSVGENKYGHPSDTVLNRIRDLGTRIMRTDKEGDIILGWD